eukprot:12250756-Heterocapsa_arctica.AAC.1
MSIGKLFIAHTPIIGVAKKLELAKKLNNGEPLTAHTLKGVAEKTELGEAISTNIARDVDWLVDELNMDLSLLARLGGHSKPRSHRRAESFQGITITYALDQVLKKIANMTDPARIIAKTEAIDIVINEPAVEDCDDKKGDYLFK